MQVSPRNFQGRRPISDKAFRQKQFWLKVSASWKHCDTSDTEFDHEQSNEKELNHMLLKIQTNFEICILLWKSTCERQKSAINSVLKLTSRGSLRAIIGHFMVKQISPLGKYWEFSQPTSWKFFLLTHTAASWKCICAVKHHVKQWRLVNTVHNRLLYLSGGGKYAHTEQIPSHVILFPLNMLLMKGFHKHLHKFNNFMKSRNETT